MSKKNRAQIHCPTCDSVSTRVVDSRSYTEKQVDIRRTRLCAGCGGRFATSERVVPKGTQRPDIPVLRAEHDMSDIRTAINRLVRGIALANTPQEESV